MRLLDDDADRAVSQAQLYLSESEARELVETLTALLNVANTNEHHHLFSEDEGCEISIPS